MISSVFAQEELAMWTLNCDMMYYERQPDLWKDWGNGLMLGLYNRPPLTVAECEPCGPFADALISINGAFVSLFDIREIWINKWEL